MKKSILASIAISCIVYGEHNSQFESAIANVTVEPTVLLQADFVQPIIDSIDMGSLQFGKVEAGALFKSDKADLFFGVERDEFGAILLNEAYITTPITETFSLSGGQLVVPFGDRSSDCITLPLLFGDSETKVISLSGQYTKEELFSVALSLYQTEAEKAKGIIPNIGLTIENITASVGGRFDLSDTKAVVGDITANLVVTPFEPLTLRAEVIAGVTESELLAYYTEVSYAINEPITVAVRFDQRKNTEMIDTTEVKSDVIALETVVRYQFNDVFSTSLGANAIQENDEWTPTILARAQFEL